MARVFAKFSDRNWIIACALLLLALGGGVAIAGDMGDVPLLNGERNDSLDLWGGPLSAGNISSFTKESSVVHSGTGAYQANLGSLANGGFGFFQMFSSSLPSNAAYRQDRDLTQYSSLGGYVRNDTASPLTFSLEIKDYRDSNSERATRSFTIPAGATWTKIDAPLDLSSGWTVDGTPDLTRTFAVSFLVNANAGAASGSLYLDDFDLTEKGGSLDPSTAPIHDVVERLAKRQFLGLWAARNKTSGLIPNSSTDTSVGALNTTTGVVWDLPSAVKHGWVTQTDADAYMGQLVTTLNTNRNQTTYLPTRFLDLVTGAPDSSHEESSIDASFMALALHSYKDTTTSPALKTSIDTLENRFNFSVFAGTGAYKQAYYQTTGQFNSCGTSPCTYNGYTDENKVIAMAGALNTANNVPLASMWNKDTGRTLTSLTTPENYLTYSFGTDYRASFAQALINLFVDTSQRGADSYATRSLARNPWENFVRSEADVSARLAQLGRSNYAQPDAGQGPDASHPGSLTYQPWNLFNNFGQPNLFQPWSVGEALLAGAPGADAALRYLLDNGLGNGLDGPQGLADWALWSTGAADPTSVPSFADNWNIALSTMAMMAYLDGTDRQSALFANQPEVKAALDTVFIAGDYNGDGVVNSADYDYWRSTFGSTNSLAADGNNDGVVDMADYVVWREHVGSSGLGAGARVPEPDAWLIAISAVGTLFFCIRGGRTGRDRLRGSAETA
ncbi:MAG TPA: dockerin type I repeat-containing protein [Lacipirellulaceae bacterium]|jgi:hypothetical protein|nr:dockerin type I repeat-containing protein [Lacipirellulaceae bacterium]